jgi:hypothetical protein
MKRYLMTVIVLWTSLYINVGIAPVQEPVGPEAPAKIREMAESLAGAGDLHPL